MPGVEANLEMWDVRHDWAEAGDEWKGQAEACGKPYEEWKRSLFETLIRPRAAGQKVVEIAPGYGRWSEPTLQVAEELWLVDISPSCIDACRNRFGNRAHYYLTDGTSLPPGLDGRIGFVFSIASFVHMDENVIRSYLQEIRRVLEPGGEAIIHHAGRLDWALRFQWLRKGRYGRFLYRQLSMGLGRGDAGRSNMSAQLFARLAHEANLEVADQFRFWADGYGMPLFRDRITVLRRR